MAQSQRLLTPIRLFVGTATMILVPYFLLPLEKVSWHAGYNLILDITHILFSVHPPRSREVPVIGHEGCLKMYSIS